MPTMWERILGKPVIDLPGSGSVDIEGKPLHPAPDAAATGAAAKPEPTGHGGHGHDAAHAPEKKNTKKDDSEHDSVGDTGDHHEDVSAGHDDDDNDDDGDEDED